MVWDGHWNERGKRVTPNKASLDYTSPADGRQERRYWISLPQFSWFCLACFCIPRGPVWFWRCCQASRSSCICSSMLPLKKKNKSNLLILGRFYTRLFVCALRGNLLFSEMPENGDFPLSFEFFHWVLSLFLSFEYISWVMRGNIWMLMVFS